jgi:hypothetical protein
MKSNRNIVLKTTIAALALACIFVGTANAQLLVKDARFTLPFKAKLADTVLPAGDYTVSVSLIANRGYALYRVAIAGAGQNKTILAPRALGPRVGEKSMLVTANSGGINAIRALHLPTANLVLTFPTPKTGEETAIAQAPEVTQSVPILMATK